MSCILGNTFIRIVMPETFQGTTKMDVYFVTGLMILNVYALIEDARLSVELSDTVPPDTTPSTNFWKINIQKLKLKNTDFTLHMPGDTLQVNAYLGDALARTTYLDLYKGLYQIQHLDYQIGQCVGVH